jgi:hypothetical protein
VLQNDVTSKRKEEINSGACKVGTRGTGDAQALMPLIFLSKYLFLSHENYILLRVTLLLLTLFFHKASVHFNGRIEIPINMRGEFLIIEPTRRTNFSIFFYFGIKFYTFQTVPLWMISSFPMYTQQWYMSYSFADSLRVGSGCSILILLASCQQTSTTLNHCCVYSGELLMMDRGTV